MAVLKRGFPGEKSHRTDNTAFGIGAAGMGNKKYEGERLFAGYRGTFQSRIW